jgi:transposase
MPAPSRFSAEQRAKAVRFVIEGRDEYPSEWAAMCAVAKNIGTTPETVRTWVRKSQLHGDPHRRVSSDELEELKLLRREVAELRRANEILKAASAFFAAELDRPQRRS